jgi:hypothetical protein
VASVSDIHLGHPRTSTQHIVNNLITYLCNDRVFSVIDLLVIAGDVYDDIVDMQSQASHHIKRWIDHVCALSAKHGVIVRVLEGTPSHDRGQSQHFTSAVESFKQHTGIDVDLKYIPELSIEYIDKLQAHVLYVPDEWRQETSETLSLVDAGLAQHGISQVDIAVMHGMFTHHAPSVLRPGLIHDSEAYLKRVRSLIFVGHDHHHSHDRRIYVQGSFDRLVHGEQEPKGYLLAHIDGTNWTVTFCENKDALRYDTLELNSADVQVCMAKVAKALSKIPEGSHIRLKSRHSDTLRQVYLEMKKTALAYHWSVPLDISSKKTTHSERVQAQAYVPIALNERTIVDLAIKRAQHAGEDTERITAMAAFIQESL